eukprot:5860294-Pleurochrysis_carterae.AAC.2
MPGEGHLPVLVKSLSRDINRLGALLDGVGHLGEGVGEDGAKHGVHHGDVLRRADLRNKATAISAGTRECSEQIMPGDITQA